VNVLVVEDETDIRDLIVLHLKRGGFTVDEAASGDEGMKKISAQTYDIFVLDWMLPGMSGLEMTQTLKSRKATAATPILMVTAKGESKDVVAGLEAGADDYVTKPFDPPVLVARVKALARRAGATPPESGDVIKLGGLRIRPEFHDVKCNGELIQLTPSEFKLLLALAASQGRVLTRSKLIELVQGSGVSVVDRAVDTHVFGLRKKLGECADVIETVRGVGYRVKAEG
jgi:two-component system phosphate regulon response regulator PhoB